MIIDTGYKCPEIQSFGFFPFAIENDFTSLANNSGWSGPVNKIDNRRTGVSGIIGDGTFYPAPASLDALSRLFWCVRDYSLAIKVSKMSFADSIECRAPSFPPELAAIYPPYTAFTYCGIGVYGGDPTELGDGETFTKTLTTRDYCSHTAPTGTFNTNKTGICPTELYSGITQNINSCVPINPIQKFNDLLCRKSFFTWAPKQDEWQKFNTGNYREISSPYLMKMSQFRVTTPTPVPPYDCDLIPLFQDSVHGMFTLSLMDTDGLAYSGNSIKYASKDYRPDLNDWISPFDCLGKSGEALTNSWGEITGYGINPKPSGIGTPVVFDGGSGFPEYPLTGEYSKNYFPFIHFQLRLRNTPVVTLNTCPVNDTISTIQTRSGQRPVGYFEILDFISGNTISADQNTSILRVPLFASSTSGPNELLVTATLRPGQKWINLAGETLY